MVTGACCAVAQRPAPVVEEPTGGSEPDLPDEDRSGDEDGGRVAGGEVGSARIGQGGVGSGYAGAMLLHAFFDRVDAAGVLGGVCAGSARARYDDLGLLTGTCVAFALGVSSVEGVKHLIRSQVGPLAGLAVVPELRTLRPRLAALADRCDPLGLQRRLAAAMLAADAPGLGVYFVDDHFVPYEGAKPVGKGWNTKRRHAQRGRDDTLVTDYHGRAVCFA
ncbi:MAG: putative transposase, partial [Pseudonocardiaceae bacterium]